MNFILPGANVKMLARAVNCFSKIGNELFFDATPHGLELKTINSTSTAYAVVQFRKDFFISYQQGNGDTQDENCCKISMKPILKIFKSLATIQTCKIWLDVGQSKIIFQFRCKSDVLKTHKIFLLESEHINSLNLSQTFPSDIVGHHRVFSNILVHLYHSVDEITFDLKEHKTIVSNFVDNDQSDRSTLRSSLAIDTTAFQSYSLSESASLTFCYKEFKAVTMFATLNKLNIQMSFSKAGSPLMLQMSKADTVQAKFIMGTMQPSPQLHTRRANLRKQAQRNTSNRSFALGSEGINTYLTEDITNNDNTETSQLNRPNPKPPNQRTKDTSQNLVEAATPGTINEIEEIVPNDTDGNVARTNCSQRHERVNSIRDHTRSRVIAPSSVPSSEAIFSDKHTENLPFLDGLNVQPARANRRDTLPTLSNNTMSGTDARRKQQPAERLQSPLSGAPNSDSTFSRKRPQAGSPPPSPMITERPAEDCIAESPEAIEERKRKQAKLRHIFRRCFEPTFHPAMQSGYSKILAPNSDSEEDNT